MTYERALVLFCFCSELCLRALREASSRYFHTITSISLRFITGSLSMWVCASGGWVSYLFGGLTTILHQQSCSVMIKKINLIMFNEIVQNSTI